MELNREEGTRYYVYSLGALSGIYEDATSAVAQAQEENGIVLDTVQRYIWESSNTPDRASISAQDLPEAVAQASLDLAALNEALKGQGSVIDITGCTLEQILYEAGVQRPDSTAAFQANGNVFLCYMEDNG